MSFRSFWEYECCHELVATGFQLSVREENKGKGSTVATAKLQIYRGSQGPPKYDASAEIFQINT